MKLRDFYRAACDVVDNADDTGWWGGDLTVTSKEAVNKLCELLPEFQEFIEQWEKIQPPDPRDDD